MDARLSFTHNKNKGVFSLTIFFFFLLKIENSDENVFDWIFENIFNKNIFLNDSKTGNNKISFLMFSVEIRNLILNKMKTQW